MSEDVEEIEVSIEEDELSVAITDGGEFYMFFPISFEMGTAPCTKTFLELGLPATIAGAKIPSKPYVKNSEQGIIPVSCDDNGFTVDFESVGPGTLPVTVEMLIAGG